MYDYTTKVGAKSVLASAACLLLCAAYVIDHIHGYGNAADQNVCATYLFHGLQELPALLAASFPTRETAATCAT
jgi:hypothetical protein